MPVETGDGMPQPSWWFGDGFTSECMMLSPRSPGGSWRGFSGSIGSALGRCAGEATSRFDVSEAFAPEVRFEFESKEGVFSVVSSMAVGTWSAVEEPSSWKVGIAAGGGGEGAPRVTVGRALGGGNGAGANNVSPLEVSRRSRKSCSYAPFVLKPCERSRKYTGERGCWVVRDGGLSVAAEPSWPRREGELGEPFGWPLNPSEDEGMRAAWPTAAAAGCRLESEREDVPSTPLLELWPRATKVVRG